MFATVSPSLTREHARAAQRTFDLLGGSADLISLGIVAARGSAAARRALTDTPLDEIDRSALGELAVVVRSTAKTIEFFGTGGQSGIQPAEAFAGRLDVTLDAVLGDEGTTTDPKELSTHLEILAVKIETFADSPEHDTANVLLQLFSSLTDGVRRDTSSVGESTSVL